MSHEFFMNPFLETQKGGRKGGERFKALFFLGVYGNGENLIRGRSYVHFCTEHIRNTVKPCPWGKEKKGRIHHDIPCFPGKEKGVFFCWVFCAGDGCASTSSCSQRRSFFFSSSLRKSAAPPSLNCFSSVKSNVAFPSFTRTMLRDYFAD